MNGYLLDTHVWLWTQQGNQDKLNAELRQQLEQRQQARQVFISAISILEVARLVALKQVFLSSSVDEFVAEGTRDEGLVLISLSPRVLIASTRLPGEVHRDPNDRLIIATAREHELTLITGDKDILRYAKQGHLKVRKP